MEKIKTLEEVVVNISDKNCNKKMWIDEVSDGNGKVLRYRIMKDIKYKTNNTSETNQ